MNLGLDGNAALVTAGSSGLGLASAEALAAAGADVAVCGRTAEHITAARETLEAAGDGDVLVVKADITDADAVERFVDETVEAFGGLDHVVTSAGHLPFGSFLEMDDEDFQDAYDLLVMSVVRTTRAAHPHLVEGDGGSIVNITGCCVKEVIDGLVLGNSVFRAVIGLMKTQAGEFAPDVRVNAVLPGGHETPPVTDRVEQSVERGEFESYAAGMEAWSEGIPMDRMGDPSELGETVAWLCSDAASYVTGTAIPVDGGWMRSV
jgi:NAD(P)-dependent dehydrogenase (short-subunit alcohol dehydrogenase family)